MLGLGNSLLRSSGAWGPPYMASVTSLWEMQDSGLVTPPVVVDAMGVDNLIPTLGQALDFDGVNDTAVAPYAMGDLVDAQTGNLTFAAMFKAGGAFSTARCPLYGGGHISLGPFIALTSAMQPQVYFYYTHTVSTNTQAIATATSLTVTANVPYMLMATISPTVGSTSCPVVFTRINLATGVVTQQTVSVTLAGNFVAFKKLSDATNDALHFMCATGTAAYMTGTGFSAAVGLSAPNYADVLAILKNSSSSAAEIEAVMGARSFCHYADGGSGATITESTGNNFGHAGNITISADYATMWLNGTHESGFPQKGFGGGSYTGGIGISVLHTFDTGDDVDPGVIVSTNEYDALGDTFTWSGWIYKPTADSPDGCSFWSTLDAAAASPRGFIVRGGMAARSQHLSDIQFEVYGATINSNDAVVAADATGWWFVAVTMIAGTPAIYVAQPAASSLTRDSGTAAGSLSVTTAGDNRLTIGHRVGSVAGQTQDNCEAGTKFDGTMYRAGVALTEAELLKVFKFYRSRYL